MSMVNGVTGALGRSAVWMATAAISLLFAEVYYVQPELASVVPGLRLSDLAVGLVSALAQQSAAGSDLPLRLKVRLALCYVTGLVAQARRARVGTRVGSAIAVGAARPAGAARARLVPARAGLRSSAARWESRSRPVCGSCRARFSPTESSAVAARRARP